MAAVQLSKGDFTMCLYVDKVATKQLRSSEAKTLAVYKLLRGSSVGRSLCSPFLTDKWNKGETKASIPLFTRLRYLLGWFSKDDGLFSMNERIVNEGIHVYLEKPTENDIDFVTKRSYANELYLCEFKVELKDLIAVGPGPSGGGPAATQAVFRKVHWDGNSVDVTPNSKKEN